MLLSDHDRLIAVKRNETSSTMTIPILSKQGAALGVLECIDQRLCQDEAIIADLTDWRQRYMHCFLTQFTATPQRTRAWLLKAVLPASDRILFLIRDNSQQPIGNIGLCNITAESAEIDHVLRGRPSETPHFMAEALRSLLVFTFQTPTIQTICLHVFSNNAAAIRLYERVGFTKAGSVKLLKTPTDDGIRFDPCSDSEANVDFDYTRMVLTRTAMPE